MNPEFLSGEASASPAVEPLVDAARALDEAGVTRAQLSARNGLRTTASADLPLASLTPMDFVEVADYDPRLDRLLCMGRREPHRLAPAHHLMLRAKKEIHVVVSIGDAPAGPQLDVAMSALKELRGKDVARVGGLVVATGRTPMEAAQRALAEVRG